MRRFLPSLLVVWCTEVLSARRFAVVRGFSVRPSRSCGGAPAPPLFRPHPDPRRHPASSGRPQRCGLRPCRGRLLPRLRRLRACAPRRRGLPSASLRGLRPCLVGVVSWRFLALWFRGWTSAAPFKSPPSLGRASRQCTALRAASRGLRPDALSRRTAWGLTWGELRHGQRTSWVGTGGALPFTR
jgi:hypothetical protein